MTENSKLTEREELLADIAEMYYMEGKTQAEISKSVGVTRSAISRMLTEARQKGIVEIHIHRPLRYNEALEIGLIEQFGLIGARVVNANPNTEYSELQKRLGMAAALEFATLLKPGVVIGIAWGTTVFAVINAYGARPVPNSRVVQLLGVLGSARHSYSGQTLVENLASKLGGEAVYLYTPFMVESEDAAAILMNDHNVKQAVALGATSDIALLGVGSVKPEFCSLYLGGHITRHDLEIITRQGAVGDVSGHYFDIRGNPANVEFHKRLIGISKSDLLKIPVRFAAGGNPEKAEAILGALRGGYINYLTTDSLTAARIIELAAGSLVVQHDSL